MIRPELSASTSDGRKLARKTSPRVRSSASRRRGQQQRANINNASAVTIERQIQRRVVAAAASSRPEWRPSACGASASDQRGGLGHQKAGTRRAAAQPTSPRPPGRRADAPRRQPASRQLSGYGDERSQTRAATTTKQHRRLISTVRDDGDHLLQTHNGFSQRLTITHADMVSRPAARRQRRSRHRLRPRSSARPPPAPGDAPAAVHAATSTAGAEAERPVRR